MIPLRRLEERPDEVRLALAHRGSGFDLDPVMELLKDRRSALLELEGAQARRNAGSKEVGALMRVGKRAEAEVLKSEIAGLGDRIPALQQIVDEVEARVDALCLQIPNIPDGGVPVGASAEENVVVRSWGEAPSFDFEPRDHHDIGVGLGLLDFERAVKVCGTRFAVLRGSLARLNRALMAFMLDRHSTEHGYVEVLPPFLVNGRALKGTGQLPKFEEDLFRLRKPEDWYLVPTAEVPVTNLHAEEILDDTALPVRYVAYTPCFRAEAGSYGRDTRGLVRQHQFEKVELVQFTRPEDSEAAHEALTGHAEAILKALGLPYRVVLLCTGDMGFAAARCYDIEVWLPGQGTFREISSCSNFRDFQARRANIRFRRERGGKPEFVHTLNGSGLPLGRTLLAILENFQRADGSVDVPPVLRPYMGGIDRLA